MELGLKRMLPWLAFGCLLGGGMATAVAAPQGSGLVAFKTEQKLDATLAALLRESMVLARTHDARSAALRQAAGRLARLNDRDAVQVYVRLHRGAALVPSVLRAAGLQIEIANERYGIVQGWIAPDALAALAQLSSVRRVTVPDYAFTRTGSVNSQGDVQLRAHDLRGVGITGANVKVGVISDGAINRATAVSSGDLPAGVQIVNSPGDGDEGTAMLEIVHDLAPGASLAFCGVAAAVDTSLQFIQCVQDLDTAGADIIVDDIGFFLEPYFEDGMVAQAVKTAATGGVDYVTAAGNNADGQYY
ncbi:MAG TPA: hypothetical protein VNJ47_04015, partial [Nevskiales bacterium]|nr:hypothetical protein [Nevskiales bacterium]